MHIKKHLKDLLKQGSSRIALTLAATGLLGGSVGFTLGQIMPTFGETPVAKTDTVDQAKIDWIKSHPRGFLKLNPDVSTVDMRTAIYAMDNLAVADPGQALEVVDTLNLYRKDARLAVEDSLYDAGQTLHFLKIEKEYKAKKTAILKSKHKDENGRRLTKQDRANLRLDKKYIQTLALIEAKERVLAQADIAKIQAAHQGERDDLVSRFLLPQPTDETAAQAAADLRGMAKDAAQKAADTQAHIQTAPQQKPASDPVDDPRRNLAWEEAKKYINKSIEKIKTPKADPDENLADIKYKFDNYAFKKVTRLSFKYKGTQGPITEDCFMGLVAEPTAPKGVHPATWCVGSYKTAKQESNFDPSVPCYLWQKDRPRGLFQFKKGTANGLGLGAYPTGYENTLPGVKKQIAMYARYFKNNYNDIIEFDKYRRKKLVNRQYMIEYKDRVVVFTATAAHLAFPSHAGLGIIKGYKSRKNKTPHGGLAQLVDAHNENSALPVKVMDYYKGTDRKGAPKQDFRARFTYALGDPINREKDLETAQRIQKYFDKPVVLAEYWDEPSVNTRQILALGTTRSNGSQLTADIKETNQRIKKLYNEQKQDAVKLKDSRVYQMVKAAQARRYTR